MFGDSTVTMWILIIAAMVIAAGGFVISQRAKKEQPSETQQS